jgi:hypothetical protein
LTELVDKKEIAYLRNLLTESADKRKTADDKNLLTKDKSADGKNLLTKIESADKNRICLQKSNLLTMKKPCRLDGSTQQLKSLHHASQPRAGADISNASNNPPDVCLGRTFQ